MSSELYPPGVTVWVLLATYNGEEYLREFLASLQASTYLGWVLYVYDDGSQDETLSILQAFSQEHPDKIRWADQGHQQRRGAKQAFAHLAQQVLLESRSRDLFAFADQDDIWDATKLMCLVERYKKAKQQYGDIPLLLYSDLVVVDAKGTLLSPSLMAMQNSKPVSYCLSRALVQNAVTGCACLVNFQLLSLALPMPREAIMHDWWLALVACSFGRAIYLPERLVQYRQHASNTIGAKNYGVEYALTHLWAGLQGRTTRIQLRELVEQCRALSKHPRFSDLAGLESHSVIESFTALPEYSFLARCQVMSRYGISRPGLLRNVALAVDLLKL